MASAFTIDTRSGPYSTVPPILARLTEAKAAKGITFAQIGEAINHDELWVACAFLGQAKFTDEELVKVSQLLDVNYNSLVAGIGPNWFPRRADVTTPITDPTLYRLYEGLLVYGQPIKAIINEKFGDGIMSMIDCSVTVDKKADPHGDRVILTFDGKFLHYKKW